MREPATDLLEMVARRWVSAVVVWAGSVRDGLLVDEGHAHWDRLHAEAAGLGPQELAEALEEARGWFRYEPAEHLARAAQYCWDGIGSLAACLAGLSGDTRETSPKALVLAGQDLAWAGVLPGDPVVALLLDRDLAELVRHPVRVCQEVLSVCKLLELV